MDYSFNLVALQLFTGLALGSILVLTATGLSLIFGMLTVVNFAHGAFFMVGAYAGVASYAYTHSFWLSLAIVPVVSALLGMVSERWLIRPLYGRGLDYPVLLTFGMAYVLVETIRILFGLEGMEFEVPEALQGATSIGIGMFPTYRLFLIGVCAAVMVALWLFLDKTRFGLVLRAGARDPVILRVLGFNVSKVWMLVFGLGCALAGFAGFLAAPIRGVTPEMGQPVLIEAFVVTVIGGMGSIIGAVAAGLTVGMVVSLTTLFYPEYGAMSMFVLMALILIIKPTGLFGKAGLLS